MNDEFKQVAAFSGSAPDFMKHAGDLAEFGLTEAQERELLETLWTIMATMVNLGFDVDILKHFVSADGGGRVELENSPSIEFKNDADGKERAT